MRRSSMREPLRLHLFGGLRVYLGERAVRDAHSPRRMARALMQARALLEVGNADAALQHFQLALALRRGDLVPEFQYEAWLVEPADQPRVAYLDALDDTARLLGARREYRAAIDLLRRAIR